eukprot:2566663-Rhodomonas_salina.3
MRVKRSLSKRSPTPEKQRTPSQHRTSQSKVRDVQDGSFRERIAKRQARSSQCGACYTKLPVLVAAHSIHVAVLGCDQRVLSAARSAGGARRVQRERSGGAARGSPRQIVEHAQMPKQCSGGVGKYSVTTTLALVRGDRGRLVSGVGTCRSTVVFTTPSPN